MGIYFGQYNRSLDEKGRLLIPKKLKGEGNKYYVLRGFEGCLSIYEEDKFLKLLEKIQNMDYFDEDSRHLIRIMSSSIQELPLDSHGRILLGKDLLDDYRIGREVVLIGVIDHFEIWDSLAYASYQLKYSGRYEDLAQRRK